MGENESQRWAERVIAVERERDEARAALRAISDHPKCPAWAYLITLNILGDYEKENPNG